MFKILVVEDDLELNQLFCRTLVRNGYVALGAADASQALDVLEEDQVDLIISDVIIFFKVTSEHPNINFSATPITIKPLPIY